MQTRKTVTVGSFTTNSSRGGDGGGGGGGGGSIVDLLSFQSDSGGTSTASSSTGGNSGTTANEREKDHANISANRAMWNALTSDQQINELYNMNLKLRELKRKNEELINKTTTKDLSEDEILVRNEIVEQNKKLQLDVHNLVKDLKNRCQKGKAFTKVFCF